ncbi:MAG: hypothetical protein BAJALOKI2v1_90079 [Promethearchaeota archaeon]|nr:MAG: hypothetical protein BAJALOKI2v1_90079 [Candidatus Lokiarchaeota archaeon]
MLTIKAQKENYENKELELRITVRKIQTKTQTAEGEENINIQPGEDIKLNISVLDLDSNITIEDALITYDWEYGEGVLEDQDGDGIYTATLEKIPAGSYKIEINVIIEDKYETQDLELTLTAVSPQGSIFLFLLVLIMGISIFTGITTYFIIYQKILKYPPTVRKVRKLRKRIQKDKTLKPMKVKERSSIIQDSLTEEKSHAVLKKEEEKIPKEDKITEKLEDSKVIKIDEEAKDSLKNPESSKK